MSVQSYKNSVTIQDPHRSRLGGKFIEFASDLDLSPGEWPTWVTVMIFDEPIRYVFINFDTTLTNEIRLAHYEAPNTNFPVLHIYND